MLRRSQGPVPTLPVSGLSFSTTSNIRSSKRCTPKPTSRSSARDESLSAQRLSFNPQAYAMNNKSAQKLKPVRQNSYYYLPSAKANAQPAKSPADNRSGLVSKTALNSTNNSAKKNQQQGALTASNVLNRSRNFNSTSSLSKPAPFVLSNKKVQAPQTASNQSKKLVQSKASTLSKQNSIPVSCLTANRQSKITQLKTDLERLLKKKNCMRKCTTITQAELAHCLHSLGLLPKQSKFFKEFSESVAEMMLVGNEELLAINLFIVVLALWNIKPTRQEFESLAGPGFFEYEQKKQLVELDRQQVTKISETYKHIIAKQSEQPVEESQVVQQKHSEVCEDSSSLGPDKIQINISLPGDRKERIVFSSSQNPQQIAEQIAFKYSLPQHKIKNLQALIVSKLNQG